MVDTLRLILFLDCNLACPYCCNRQRRFFDQFQHKNFNEIDFNKYKNVCITGGEPFLKKDILYDALKKIPAEKNLYLNTNGILITTEDIAKLMGIKNLKGVNVGLHSVMQVNMVTTMVNYLPRIKYLVEKSVIPILLRHHPYRLNRNNLKGWTMNDCNRPNEDWVLLHQ